MLDSTQAFLAAKLWRVSEDYYVRTYKRVLCQH